MSLLVQKSIDIIVKEKYPTIETLRMEVRNMESPPGGSQGGPARAQIWSGSYGESAKVNQFKKNLGAPPLPDTGWGSQLAGHILTRFKAQH